MTEPIESLLALAEPTLAAIRIASTSDARPEAARTLLEGEIRALRAAAERAHVAAADIDDVAYALVAFADEAMVARPATRSAWLSRLLQLALFGENTAGDGFFTRLEMIRRDPSRARVLLVYFVVLALGFRGRYASRDTTRTELIESVHLDLIRAGLETERLLAPRAIPARTRAVTKVDARWVLAAGVLACVLAVGVWALFALDLAVRAGTSLGA